MTGQCLAKKTEGANPLSRVLLRYADVLSVDVLSVDVLSVDVLSVDVLSVRRVPVCLFWWVLGGR
jgi:hypothetical protein